MTSRQEIEKAITETVANWDAAFPSRSTPERQTLIEREVLTLVDAVLQEAAKVACTCPSHSHLCRSDAIRALKSQPTEAKKP